MDSLPVYTHKVRVIHLDESPEVEGYNDGLFVGQELFGFDMAYIDGPISVMIPTEADPLRSSALFKGEYEIIEEYTKLVAE